MSLIERDTYAIDICWITQDWWTIQNSRTTEPWWVRRIVDDGYWVHCDRLLDIVSSALWSTCSLHFLRCFLFGTRGWINHPSTLNWCRSLWELRVACGNQKRKYGKALWDAKKVHFRGDVPSWMHKICSLAKIQLKPEMRWFAAAHNSCAEACYRCYDHRLARSKNRNTINLRQAEDLKRADIRRFGLLSVRMMCAAALRC